jgi:hypothetical protein
MLAAPLFSLSLCAYPAPGAPHPPPPWRATLTSPQRHTHLPPTRDNHLLLPSATLTSSLLLPSATITSSPARHTHLLLPGARHSPPLTLSPASPKTHLPRPHLPRLASPVGASLLLPVYCTHLFPPGATLASLLVHHTCLLLAGAHNYLLAGAPYSAPPASAHFPQSSPPPTSTYPQRMLPPPTPASCFERKNGSKELGNAIKSKIKRILYKRVSIFAVVAV